MKYIHVYLTTLPLVCLLSAVLYWRAKERVNGLLAACTPLALYNAAATVGYHAIGGVEDDSWTSCILAVPLALSRGINGYSTLDAGSVQTAMYPPVWAAAYSVVGVVRDPAFATALGFVFTAAYTLAAVWAFSRASGGDWALSSCVTGLLAFGAWKIEPLWYVVYRVRPDAPALGFALLACAAAVMSKNGRRWGLPGAMFLAWMSVGSKQVMLPLLVVLPLWITWTHGKRVWRRLAAWGLLSGAAVALPWLLWIPFEGLWLNLVTIPSRCPWGGVWPLNLVRVAGELWVDSLIPLAILTAAIAAGAFFQNQQPPLREFLASPAGLVLIVAAAHVPLSLMGRLKLGGDPNTLCPTIYFVWAAAVAAVVTLCREPEKHAEAWGTAIRARAVVGIVLLLAIPGWSYQLLRSARQRGAELGRNADQQAFEFLRFKGRKVYFPLRPLAHLEASGKLYHSARAVYDREVQAGIPLSQRQIEEFFPSNPEAVCWDDRWGAEYVRERYFLNYRRRIRLAGLDMFRCFAAGGTATEAPDAGGSGK